MKLNALILFEPLHLHVGIQSALNSAPLALFFSWIPGHSFPRSFLLLSRYPARAASPRMCRLIQVPQRFRHVVSSQFERHRPHGGLLQPGLKSALQAVPPALLCLFARVSHGGQLYLDAAFTRCRSGADFSHDEPELRCNFV
jgi:hypothetical protein